MGPHYRSPLGKIQGGPKTSLDHLQEVRCSQPQCTPISPISRHGKPIQNVKLSKTWKTATIWMPDYLPDSSTACYQVCTLLEPTALPLNASTLYPAPLHQRTTHSPLTTDLFQVWKTGFRPTTDCLPASSTAFYEVCTLLGPTAVYVICRSVMINK